MSHVYRVSFQYREFYDFPRQILVPVAGGSLLLDCPFDEVLDDYRKDYEVFRLPPVEALDLAGSWLSLRDRRLESLGIVPAEHVILDPTRRQWIDLESVLEFLRHEPGT